MSTFTYNVPDEAIQFEPRPKAERGAQCTLKISVGPSRNGLLWLVNGKPIGTAAQMAAVLAVTLRALEKEASR